jgi:hypothetical protein
MAVSSRPQKESEPSLVGKGLARIVVLADAGATGAEARFDDRATAACWPPKLLPSGGAAGSRRQRSINTIFTVAFQDHRTHYVS